MWACVCVGGGGRGRSGGEGGGWDGGMGGGGVASISVFLRKQPRHIGLLFTNRSENGWPCFRDFQTSIFNKCMLFFSLFIYDIIYSIPIDIYVSLLGVSARFLFLNDFYSFCARLKFWREYF